MATVQCSKNQGLLVLGRADELHTASTITVIWEPLTQEKPHELVHH